VIWTIWFSEAPLMPSLDLPDEARHLLERLWAFLQTYQLSNANQYKDRCQEPTVSTTMLIWRRTSPTYRPIHRYPIYRQDFSGLYRFFRENFYAVLNFGELDLVAELLGIRPRTPNPLEPHTCGPRPKLA
jgi:hypothetical protein